MPPWLLKVPIINAAGCTFLHPREDLRRVGGRLGGDMAPDTLQKPSYFPTGEETLVLRR